MTEINCKLECGHEIVWGETPETPGAVLPWIGMIIWCQECEEDQEILETDPERFNCIICCRSAFVERQFTISSTVNELLKLGWKGSMKVEGEYVCDNCNDAEDIEEVS